MRKIIFGLLVLTASCTSLTATCQIRDSIIEVQLSRLRAWAAKRAVSDTIIREIAHDYARLYNDFVLSQKAQVQCDTIIARQAREIGNWKDAEAARSDELWLSERKRKRGNTREWIVRLVIGIYFLARP